MTHQIDQVLLFSRFRPELSFGRPTGGGRVLGVTAVAPSLEEALARAYEAMAEIHFKGIYYRHDIGHRALACSHGLQAGQPAGR